MKIIFDIDGTLGDPLELVAKYVPGNWEEYYKHTLEVKPIWPMVTLLDTLDRPGNVVYICTCRLCSNNYLTMKWLREICHLTISPFRVYYRDNGNKDPGWKVKLEMYNRLKPDLIFEDEPETINAALLAGYTVVQVHGHRDAKKADYIPE